MSDNELWLDDLVHDALTAGKDVRLVHHEGVHGVQVLIDGRVVPLYAGSRRGLDWETFSLELPTECGDV